MKQLSRDLKTEFMNLIRSFYRNHDDVSAADMMTLCNLGFVSYADIKAVNEHNDESVLVDNAANISEKDKSDFKAMWDKMMQLYIDFLNSHPNVVSEMNRVQEDLYKEWNKDNTEEMYSIRPNDYFSFGADNVMYSAEQGSWQPATDSYCNISISNKAIISMY